MSMTGASSNQIINTSISTSNLIIASSSSANSDTAQNQTNSLSQPGAANQVASKQSLNNSAIKIIQRLLDEASQTGDLLLTSRNLNEFPSKLAINYDLSDTLNADLSKNHLTEFPKELCTYDSLEKLILYSNQIRTIPDISVFQLKCLKYLDLNSNNLSYLPPCLCNLASLEVLTVNNNKLVSLPEEIGRLDKLIQLDVSCNEITHLPVQIGDMSSLRALNVRRNLLVELPKEIAQLKLVSFDCSSNRLNKLPLCFREMVTLIDLVIDHNPLEVPPAHICTKGLLHIMKYLLVEAIKEEKKRGILTEYEINTQYNSLNYNLSAHHQRLSCTAGLGYMFQSSVRSMNKKLGSTSSTISSASSTSSSSSVSSSSLTTSSQMPTPVYNTNKQQHIKNSSFIDLPPSHPPPPPPPNQSQSSSINTTPTNNQYFNPTQSNNFTILNLNNSYKLNNDIDNVDYGDSPSTSSPTSTKSSSSSSSLSTNGPLNIPIKSSIKPSKIQETSNSKCVSIHELISLKSPTSQYQQQTSNLSNLKFNNRSTNESFDQQIEQQTMWRLNNNDSSKKLAHEEFISLTNKSKQAKVCDPNQSLLNSTAPLSTKSTTTNTTKRFNNSTHDSYEILSNTIQKNLQIDGTSYATLNKSDKRYSNPQAQKPSTVNKPYVSNETISDDLNVNLIKPNSVSSCSSSSSSNQFSYNDELTPTNQIKSYFSEHQNNNNIMFNQDNFLDLIGTDLNNYIISVDNQEHVNDEYSKYYKHQQPAQTQIWVPRDDLNGNESPANLENINPAFTIRRNIIHVQEEQKQIEVLRKTIETKLKIQLPSNVDELGVALSDGVVLCHLMNQIFPRAVQIIHVPSLAVPKLSLAKCRKNVENFIDACRRLGLPENDICCAHDIIEAKNTPRVARTVIILVGYNQYLQQQHQQQQQQDTYNRQTTIGNVMSHPGMTSLQVQQQQQQQQTAV